MNNPITRNLTDMKCTEARRIIKEWQKKKEQNEDIKIYHKINEKDKTVTLLIWDGKLWHTHVCKADKKSNRISGKTGDGSTQSDNIEYICGNCIHRDDCLTKYSESACSKFKYNGGMKGNTFIKPNRTRGAY